MARAPAPAPGRPVAAACRIARQMMLPAEDPVASCGRYAALRSRAEPPLNGNVGLLRQIRRERAMAVNAISGQGNIGKGERIGSVVAGIVLITRAVSRPTAGRDAGAHGRGPTLAHARN